MAFEGKTAVITGGTRGMGLSTARYLLKEEVSNVALLDICENRENVQQLQDEFPQANIVYLSLDASIRAAVEETFKQILDRFHQIDIAINCAGILNELDLQRTINVNLIGLINTSLSATNAMSRTNGGNGGVVVNISSTAGLTPVTEIPFYTASKHGVIGFTRAMASESFFDRHGVRFAVVCPGLTLTPILQECHLKLNPLFADGASYAERISTMTRSQTADQCGKNIVTVAVTSHNGGVWILDGGEIEEVTIPEFWKF